MGTVHIVGAGMAGLAAAVRLAETEHRVVLHDSAGQAGGRCRSFRDETMGCVIDNGNHLLLSGNTAVNRFLATIDASDELDGPADATFPFVELPDGPEWTVRFDRGRIPCWIFQRDRRIPGTRLADYLNALRLATAGPDTPLSAVVNPSAEIFRRFWEPLTVAVLNTPADQASARLLWAVARETFGRGAEACLPRIAKHGLSETFVEPTLRYLEERNVDIRFNRRLRNIRFSADLVSQLEFGDGVEPLDAADSLVLAVPSSVAADLFPESGAPTQCHAIVNAHFRLEGPVPCQGSVPILGLVGATAHWLFFRDDIVSATVSAADELAKRPSDEIAQLIWNDITRAVKGVSGGMPRRHRVIKEKRATFSQTPSAVRSRPPTRTRFGNMFLAGDWTDTGLPATIEGAIRSGNSASAAILGIAP